ncbi:MAG: oxygenase MpaB family protein, partial [Bacteroidota bacterium]
QEDMAGTNLAFSFIILRGLRKSGRIINSQEAEAYQHLWNVIGYILGLDEEIIPSNLKKAYLLTQAIEIRQMKPSFEGKALTKALLNNYEDQLPIKLPEGYITSYMRYLIGDEKADILDLPPTNWTSNLIKVQKLSNTLGQYISVLLNKQAGRKFDMQQIAAEKPKMSIPQKLGVD